MTRDLKIFETIYRSDKHSKTRLSNRIQLANYTKFGIKIAKTSKFITKIRNIKSEIKGLNIEIDKAITI